MQNSGTKLVLALVAMAVLLGVVSWWYRYEAAHRASQFWGPEASRLIAESRGFEVLVESSDGKRETVDLSNARGQAHLRHALLSDRNYAWETPLTDSAIPWHWRLRFHEGEQEASVLLSENFHQIGKINAASGAVTSHSCEPMTVSLRQYFEALGLVDKSPAVGASNSEE